MTVEIFATTPNQGITTLNGALTNSATSMPVDSIANLGLTGISSPDFALLVITKIANWHQHPINNPATFEIVKLTAVSGDTGTIVRGQDDTSGIAFADRDIVECVFVSKHYQHIVDALTDGTKELSVGAFTYNGDLSQGASGVDKTWSTHITPDQFARPTGAPALTTFFPRGDRPMKVLDFDQTTVENALVNIAMPQDYDGSALKVEFFWTASAGTTGAVVWQISGYLFSDGGDLLSIAWGSLPSVVDSFIATDELHIASVNTTPSGTGGYLSLLTGRAATNGSDNFNADARLLGVRVSYA